MAPLHYLCVFTLLFSSVVAIKAEEENTQWKQRMEEEMKRILEIVEEQRKVIRRQDLEIAALKSRVDTLEERTPRKEEEEAQSGQQTSMTNTKSKANQFINTIRDNHSPPKGLQRRFLDGSPGEQTPVAFYAYISKDFTHVGDNHVFIFDTIVTNSGHAYSNYSGIFTAPSSGLYAFAYSIAVAGYHIAGDTDGDYGEISVQLVRNATPYGSIAADTERASDDEMATGFAILYLNAYDIVKVTAPGQGQGSFRSNKYEHWSFSGFKIQ